MTCSNILCSCDCPPRPVLLCVRAPGSVVIRRLWFSLSCGSLSIMQNSHCLKTSTCPFACLFPNGHKLEHRNCVWQWGCVPMGRHSASIWGSMPVWMPAWNSGLVSDFPFFFFFFFKFLETCGSVAFCSVLYAGIYVEIGFVPLFRLVYSL